ncbi:MAG: OmpH family outer membrane protein [Planctomycetota bacterium]
MSRAERFFVYTAALVALAAGLGSLTIDRTATASNHAAEHNAATVNVLDLMQESLQQEPFLSEREGVAAEFTAQIQTAEAEVQRLQQELQLGGATAPNAQMLRQQYQAAAQRLQQIGGDATNQFQTLSARQAAEAYQTVHAATDRVAAANGYEIVFASNRNAAIEGVLNLTAITQEILARPVLYGTTVDDITSMVRTDLGLPDPAEADAEAETDAESSEDSTP